MPKRRCPRPPQVSLKQPHLKGAWSNPQGTRPDVVTVGFYATEEGAVAAAQNTAPPLWLPYAPGAACSGCYHDFSSVHSAHHCRNCGQLVCSSCATGRWAGSMLPPTYHNNESHVRVCVSCHRLALAFRRALKHGDEGMAYELYTTGNVNIWTPYVIEKSHEVRARLKPFVTSAWLDKRLRGR
jgi:hypothetical protein